MNNKVLIKDFDELKGRRLDVTKNQINSETPYYTLSVWDLDRDVDLGTYVYENEEERDVDYKYVLATQL